MRTIPVLYKEKSECCGCGACMAVCSQKAISLKEDEEGFFYPVLWEERCIRCWNCMDVCPFKNRVD